MDDEKDDERSDIKLEGTKISISKAAIKIPKVKKEKTPKTDTKKRRKSLLDAESFTKYRRKRPLTELAVLLETIWQELKDMPNVSLKSLINVDVAVP
jgi:hypothetical protein